MPKKQKKASLRTSILIVVFFCGVLPILIVASIGSLITRQNTHRHVNQLMTSAVESTMDTLRRDFDNIVDSGLSASYVPTVRTAYAAYLRDGDSGKLHTEVTTFLREHYSSNSRIRSTHLLFLEEVPGYRFYMMNLGLTRYADIDAFYNSRIHDKILDMAPELDTDVAFVYSRDDRLFLVRTLSLLSGRHESYAALVLELNKPLLFEALDALPWVTGAHIQISEADMYYGTDVDAALPLLASGTAMTSATNDSLLVRGDASGERYTMRYAVLADKTPVIDSAGNSFLLILLLALISVPLGFILYRFFRNKVNRPLDEMAALAHEIEGGDFGVQLDLDRLNSAETHDLGLCMNAMSARLEDQFERIYREELALRDAEIKALQSQINPHFLGNTLEIINWEARMAGDVKVSRMLEALSTMLEAVLDRNKRPLIHLSEELLYVNSYLYIAKERFGKRLTVHQQIDESLLDWYVPRLILQPIIENAVEHGTAASGEGTIILRAQRINDEWMRLEVENDRPMTEEDKTRVEMLLGDKTEPQGSHNIGIRNVHQRLRLLYGKDSGLLLKPTKNNATVCVIRIQKLQEDQIQST